MTTPRQDLTTSVRQLARVHDGKLAALADTPAARAVLEEILATPRTPPSARRAIGEPRRTVAPSSRGATGTRPATRWWLAAAVAVTISLVGAGLLSPAEPTAAWAAVPRSPAADQEAMAQEACAVDAGALEGRALPPLAVLDLRAARAYATFADERFVVGCLLAAPEDGAWSGEVVQVAERMERTGALRPDSVMTLAPDGPVSQATGEVSDGVHSVVVDIPDLGRAEASVARGRFSIWWPGEVFGVTVTALAADGTVLQTVALDELV